MRLAVLAFLLAPAIAHAGEITEASPYTLEPHEVRLGVTDVGVGLFGYDLLRRIEVGTRPIAWVPAALGVPSYDVHAKFELWRDPHLSLAVAAEHLRVNLGDDARFVVTPLEGWAGLRLGSRVRLNGGAVYTSVAVRGSTTEGPVDELGGAVGTSNLMVRASLDVRISDTIHLIAGGRFVPWQAQWVQASGQDGDTTGSGMVSSDLMDVSGRAWATSGEIHVARKHLNLRAGVEYGNYAVPIVNFVANKRGWMPVLDLYWRI
jgi:hypothetical protein